MAERTPFDETKVKVWATKRVPLGEHSWYDVSIKSYADGEKKIDIQKGCVKKDGTQGGGAMGWVGRSVFMDLYNAVDELFAGIEMGDVK